MNRKKPAILIGTNLIALFDKGIDDLLNVKSQLNTYAIINGLSAAYLFAYSIFEGTLFKVYYSLVKAFPDKANLAYQSINKNLLFSTSRTSVIIDQLCENFVHNFGHATFKANIKELNKFAVVDMKSLQLPDKEIDEFKKKRNFIAHRGLIIHNSNLVSFHIDATIEALNLLKNQLSHKFTNFTEIELIRQSCNYLFGMSDKEFNDCFKFANGHIVIELDPIEKFYGRLSSSEAHCFLLFIANYNSGISKEFKIEHLMPRVSLTDDTLDKISFINDLFEVYPHLINH